MKARITTISLTASALCWPSSVFATQGETAHGSWFALIFYGINFLLFLWIVRRYGWSRVTQFFHDRSHTIGEIRGRAEKAYREAQELAKGASQLLQHLEADQRKLMSELDNGTAYQVAQMTDAAREAVNRLQRDTEITTAALREGAQRRLRQTMAEAAGTIARELVKRNFQASDQARLLQGFINGIGEEARL
jgi:F0F1-type ATP synthase membrane subunit b/b'